MTPRISYAGDAIAVRIRARISIDHATGCWLWQGTIQPNGYGQIYMGVQHRTSRVHRVSYETFVGPIPEGLVLDHLCRNRACANPAHLEPVTIGENVMRGETIAARNRVKTHCIHGHEFTAQNTATDAKGGRRCQTCNREQCRRQHARRRAERRAAA